MEFTEPTPPGGAPQTSPESGLLGPATRYIVAGGTVATVYIGGTLALSWLGVPIAIAIAIAYPVAVSLHFVLQRWFVFANDRFALSTRQQIARYVLLGIVQYPLTAGLTVIATRMFDVSDRVGYLIAALSVSAAAFLVLRANVFHTHD